MRHTVRNTSCIVMTVLIALTYTGNLFAYADGDGQVWLTKSIEGTLHTFDSDKIERLTVKLEGEWRFGDDARELFYQHADLGFTLKKCLVPWFDLGLNYRQVWEYKHRSAEDGGNYWLDEYRPHINGTINVTLSNWKFKNNSRVNSDHLMSNQKKMYGVLGIN